MFRSLFSRLRTRGRKSPILRKAHLNVEILEDRLTPSWSAVPPTAISLPPTFTQVTLSQGTTTGTAAITGNETDWYRFNVTSAASYTFQAMHQTGNSLDTVIGIFNSSGKRLAYNDDISSSNRDSLVSVQLSGTTTAPQVYYLGITNYTGSPGGGYSWSIKSPAAVVDDSYESNNTMSSASILNQGAAVTAPLTTNNLIMADGHDWYRFSTNTAGTGGSVAINFTHAQGDLDMELYTSAGTRVGISQGTTNSERIVLDNLAAGTYFVHVYGYNGAKNPSYSLTITPPTAPPPAPTPTPGSFQIVINFAASVPADQRVTFSAAVARWQQLVTGSPSGNLTIDASERTIDGVGGILGQAGPDSVYSSSGLPSHGSMEFDSADVAALQSSGQLLNVVLHEMGHILGIGTVWQSKGLLTGYGSSNPRFTGAQATAQYNAIFGVNETGVPVENQGGPGTANAHWRESSFGNELMTGYLNSGTNPLSRITVASLGDLGYTVDISKADPYSPPAAVTTTSTRTSSRAALIGDDPSAGPTGLSGSSSPLASPSRTDLDAFWSSMPASMSGLTDLNGTRFRSNDAPSPARSESARATILTEVASATRSTRSSIAALSGSAAEDIDEDILALLSEENTAEPAEPDEVQ